MFFMMKQPLTLMTRLYLLPLKGWLVLTEFLLESGLPRVIQSETSTARQPSIQIYYLQARHKIQSRRILHFNVLGFHFGDIIAVFTPTTRPMVATLRLAISGPALQLSVILIFMLIEILTLVVVTDFIRSSSMILSGPPM